MNMGERIYTAIALAITGASVVTAHAMASDPVRDHPVRWAKDSIVTVDAGAYDAHMDLAINAWADSVPLTFVDSTHEPEVTVRPGNVPEGVGALATPTIRNGFIVGCTIVVNDKAPTFSLSSRELDTPYLISVLTHEFGHCLGMKHDNSGESSIMYFNSGAWDTGLFSFTVTAHDRDALARLYG